jgi:hypothetical protein
MSQWQDKNLHELAAEFFRDFSRMEYALKAASFMKPNRANAEADWEAFARAIHQPISENESAELAAAKTFLLQKPPKKQVNNNGQIEWSDTVPQHNGETDLLLLYVRRVRNNLFHGGKFNGRWFAPERSTALIKASSVILAHCREASDQVAEAYDA